MNDVPVWCDVREPGAKEPLWECDDDHQQQYAVICALHGFDLPVFDVWLSGLPDCSFKTGLLERRRLAAEAFWKNNNDVGVLQLEVMVEAWRRDRREQGLLPMARSGDKAAKQRKDAGISSAEEKREERQPIWDKWQAEATRIHEKHPEWSKNQICTEVGKKFDVSTRAISQRVTGVGRLRKSNNKK